MSNTQNGQADLIVTQGAASGLDSGNSVVTNNQTGFAVATINQRNGLNKATNTQTFSGGRNKNQANTFMSTQDDTGGASNTITSTQNGFLLTASVMQFGTGNTSNGSQVGDHNGATVSQTGDFNFADYSQNGSMLTANITQTGNSNNAHGSQTGLNNMVTISQTSNNNSTTYGQSGSNNTASVTQH